MIAHFVRIQPIQRITDLRNSRVVVDAIFHGGEVGVSVERLSSYPDSIIL